MIKKIATLEEKIAVIDKKLSQIINEIKLKIKEIVIEELKIKNVKEEDKDKVINFVLDDDGLNNLLAQKIENYLKHITEEEYDRVEVKNVVDIIINQSMIDYIKNITFAYIDELKEIVSMDEPLEDVGIVDEQEKEIPLDPLEESEVEEKEEEKEKKEEIEEDEELPENKLLERYFKFARKKNFESDIRTLHDILGERLDPLNEIMKRDWINKFMNALTSEEKAVYEILMASDSIEEARVKTDYDSDEFYSIYHQILKKMKQIKI